MRRSILLAVAALGSAVLIGSSAASISVREASGARQAMRPNIVEDAAATPQLSTLVSLVKKAGLVNALSSPSAHLTVFAPTNAAFAALQKADPMTFKAVSTTPALLKKILTYHVLPTEVRAAAAIAAARKHGTVKSLEGEKVSLSLEGGKLTLNGSAHVVNADIAASNGVVHLIDAVIVPPSVKVAG